MSKDIETKEMTFLEHLEDMRGVILRCVGVFISMMILVLVGFYYFNQLMLYPLNAAKGVLANFYTQTSPTSEVQEQKLGPVYLVSEAYPDKKEGPYYIVAKDNNVKLLNTESGSGDTWYADIKLRSMKFTTPIMIWVYVGLLGSFALSLPFMLFFIAKFIAPGLTKEELRIMKPVLLSAVALFGVGVSFAFLFILPTGIAFMSYLSKNMGMEMFPDAQSYYSLVVFVTMGIGLTFELPLLEVILIYLGVLKVEMLKKNRKVILVLIVAFSAIITPPDIFTQISLSLPLYLMYEIALIIGAKLRKKKEEKEAREAELLEIEEKKSDKEYAQKMAKRAKEEEAEEEKEDYFDDDNIYAEHEKYYDSYDYNDDFEDYSLDAYIDYKKLTKPVFEFAPNWDLCKPDVSFFAPDFSKEEENLQEQAEQEEVSEEVSEEELKDISEVSPEEK